MKTLSRFFFWLIRPPVNAVIFVIVNLIKLVRKIFKIYPKTTIGDLENRLRGMNKNDIIFHIVMTAAAINGTQPVLTPGYKKELRGASKRHLIKTAIIMHVQLTSQLEGKKVEQLTGMKGVKG